MNSQPTGAEIRDVMAYATSVIACAERGDTEGHAVILCALMERPLDQLSAFSAACGLLNNAVRELVRLGAYDSVDDWIEHFTSEAQKL